MTLLASMIGFCKIAAILLRCFGFPQVVQRARSGKAGLKDLALVNGQPCRDRLT